MNAAAKANPRRGGAVRREALRTRTGGGRPAAQPTTLRLFEDREPDAAHERAVDAGMAHLAAARRIARQMVRLEDHSAEQLAAGRRICRHLLAMLEDAQRAGAPAHGEEGAKRSH